MSGMERVEFYFNEVLQETVYGPGPEYTWQIRFYPIPKMIIKAIAYDNAGLSDFDCVDEISRTSYSLLNLFLNRLPILERLIAKIR